MNSDFISKKEGFFLEGMTPGQKTLMGFTLFFLLLFFYLVVSTFLTPVIKLPRIPGGLYGKVSFLTALSFLYLSYLRGWKTGLFLLLFVAVYCWAVEDLSIHTGFPFGHYFYSNKLGFKIDVTPALLGFNYFWFLVVPAYFVSNLIVDGSPFSISKTIKGMLFTAFIGAVVVAAIDIVADPLDATRLHEWVWTKNSYTGYYGIPYINYLGYLIVMTPAFFLLKLFERKVAARPLGPVNINIAAIPLLIYFLLLVLYGVPAPSGVFLVGCFTMGLPLLLAMDKLNKYFHGQSCPR